MGIMNLITVKNDGQKLIDTNYWQTEHCKAGYAYMTLNAGAYRLLVPPVNHKWLDEIRTAKEVVISRGAWPQANKKEAFEVMFEDFTDNPFAIYMDQVQWDRLPAKSDKGWKGELHIYIEASPVPAFVLDRVFYRVVKEIPCLKKAGE
jgi:hypothetical protein